MSPIIKQKMNKRRLLAFDDSTTALRMKNIYSLKSPIRKRPMQEECVAIYIAISCKV